MKTNTFKKSLIAICVLLMACVVGFFAVTLNAKTVSAEDTTFKMVPGAAVRIIDDIDGNGNAMKFKAELSIEQLANYNDTSKYSSATFGMFIMPKTYYDVVQTKFGGAKDIDDASLYAFAESGLVGENVVFIAYQMTDEDFDALEGNENQDGTYKKVRPLSLICKPVAIATDGSHFFNEIDENVTIDHYELWGSLGNIKDKNLASKYVAQAYVELVDATTGNISYEFAQIASSDRFRSPLDVSIRAVESNEYNSDPDIISYLNNFTTTYNQWYKTANGADAGNPVFEYTVEHWYNGVKVGETTATAEVGADVTAPENLSYVAANGAQSNVNYIYTDAKSTGKMYAASGELTVRVDYKEKNFLSFGDANNHKYAESYLNTVDLGAKKDGLISATVNGVAVTLDETGANYVLDLNSDTTLFSKSKDTWNKTYPVEIICAKDVIQGNITYVTQEINTKEELDGWGAIAKAQSQGAMLFDGYFVLGNDISYNVGDGQAYESFGDVFDFNDAGIADAWDAQNYGFMGTFDGKGYNIDGMGIAQEPKQNRVAFISILHTNGTIKNMSFTNFRMPGWGSGLADSVAGTIQDIYMHINWIGAGATSFREAPSAPIAGGCIFPSARISRVFIENEKADASAYAFGQTELNQGNWNDCYYIGPLTKSLLPRSDTTTDPSQGNDSVAMYSTMSEFITLTSHLNFGGWVIEHPDMWAVDSYSKGAVPAKMNFINTTANPVAISWNTTETCVAEFGAEISETASLYNMTYKFDSTTDGTKNVKFNSDMANRFGSHLIISIVEADGKMSYARAILGDLVIDSKEDLNKLGDVTKAASNKPWQWAGTVYLARNIEYNDNFPCFMTWSIMNDIKNENSDSWPVETINPDGTNKFYSEWDSRCAGFFGTFDGLGHNINGLKIGATSGALFSLLSGGTFINDDNSTTWKQGVVKNVSFTNARIDAESGFIAVDMSGRIENVYIHASYQAAGTSSNPTGFLSAKNTYGAGRVKNVVVIVDEVASVSDDLVKHTTALGAFWDALDNEKILLNVVAIGNYNGSYGDAIHDRVRKLPEGRTKDWVAYHCVATGSSSTWNDGIQNIHGEYCWVYGNDAIVAGGFVCIENPETNKYYPTTANLKKMGWDAQAKQFVAA